MQTIKLGLVGCGSISEWRHLPSILCECPEFELVALCDIDKNKLDYLSNRYGIKYKTDNFEDILKNEEIQAVDIATRHEDGLHRDLAIKSLQSGKHVFIEKPLAENLKDAFQIKKIHDVSGKILQVGFMKRYYHGYRFAKELVNSGKTGNVVGMQVRFWFGEFASKNALLCDNGIHFFDLMQYFLGKFNDIVGVRCIGSGKGFFTFSGLGSFEQDRTGTFLFSSGGNWNYPNEMVEIVTENGLINIFNGLKVTYIPREYQHNIDSGALTWLPTISAHWATTNDWGGFTPQFKDFARSINEGVEYGPNINDGINSLRFYEKIKGCCNV